MRGKRQVRRKPLDMEFVRKADGRLHPASQGRDIGDVWAELDRAKLKSAIVKDQKQRVKKQRLRRLFTKAKPTIATKQSEGGTTKTVEIKISMPDVSGAKTIFRKAKQKLRSVKLSKKQWGSLAGVTIFLVLFAASFSWYGDSSKTGDTDTKKQSGAVAGSRDLPEWPQYPTVLPVGKTIEDLGGWGRVSPPEKDPVFAFKDKIDGVEVLVSQQPLPDNFAGDKESSMEQLAQQFNANEHITAGDTQAYLGTSAQGPQSVILTKNGLLILAKSASQLSSGQWEQYLATLQ